VWAPIRCKIFAIPLFKKLLNSPRSMSRLKSLQYYLFARLLLAPVMLWTIITIVFLLMRATPGDPVDAIVGSRASQIIKDEMRVKLGLDKSLLEQYFSYLGKLLHLDFGKSLTSSGKAVSEIISEHFPATVELAVGAITIAFVVGITIGLIAAAKKGTAIEAGGRLFGVISYSLPIFWVGMLLQLIFSVKLGWFPLGGRFPSTASPPERIFGLYTIDSLLHFKFGQFFTALYYLFLPCFTLGILLSGIFERIVRVNLKESLQSDYVEAARARGIPERRVLMVHALKNSMIPVITVLGLTTASLLGGAVLTEVTFSWPGLAGRLYEAISARDYPTIQGIMVFFAAIVVIASILIDLINAWIDPRIKY
jgi:peptide/nickel transport system permease protein